MSDGFRKRDSAGDRAERGRLLLALGGAQHTEHPAHVVQCGAARTFGELHRVVRLLRSDVQDMVGDTGLDRDQAHAVGDDVVQFAADPQTFLRDGSLRELLHRSDGELTSLPRGPSQLPCTEQRGEAEQ